MQQIIFRTFLCMVAGVAGWVVVEPFFPRAMAGVNGLDPAWVRAEQVMIFLVTGLIGLAGGAAQGWMRGGNRNVLAGAGFGFLLGATLGMLGWNIGGSLSLGIFGPGVLNEPGTNPAMVLARTLAFVPGGIGLGFAVGATQMTKRAMMSGLVGGAIAATLAGLLFDVVSLSLAGPVQAIRGGEEVGITGRAFLALSLGLFIGLFTAVIDQLTRQAWVRLVLGRNEGKEWPVDAPQTTLGRDERAHVPLFLDPQVEPLHAIIVRQGGQYWVQDPGTALGVGLNGWRVQGQAQLSPGDTIQLGRLQLQFLVKGSAAARAAEGRAPAQPVGGYQTPTVAAANQLPTTQAYVPSSVSPAGATQAYPAASLAPQAVFSLLVTSGPLSGQRYPLGAGLEVGREGSGIRLGADPMASRRHASFAPRPDGVWVSDLGSTNGTFLNGQKTAGALAQLGDSVTVGGTTFRIEAG